MSRFFFGTAAEKTLDYFSKNRYHYIVTNQKNKLSLKF